MEVLRFVHVYILLTARPRFGTGTGFPGVLVEIVFRTNLILTITATMKTTLQKRFKTLQR